MMTEIHEKQLENVFSVSSEQLQQVVSKLTEILHEKRPKLSKIKEDLSRTTTEVAAADALLGVELTKQTDLMNKLSDKAHTEDQMRGDRPLNFIESIRINDCSSQ
jgi:hypothetical protein